MIPITKATLPHFEHLEREVREFFSTGMITNHHHVKKLEAALQEYLDVKHVIAVSSCTSGMMLVMKALGLRGEVIVPSFTFSATGHAIFWNGLTPKFVEIDPESYTIDPQQVRKAINLQTSAILGVHLFGCPAAVEELEKISQEHHLKLIFDAAHALGSKVGSRFIGNFGDAEVFSCSPTKLLVTGEGGLVTTNNDELARKVRIGRTYGDPGNYDCEFPGLSARMGEFNALLGLQSLKMLEKNIGNRQALVKLYRQQLAELPGITFQKINQNLRTTHKDFSLLIDPRLFGLNREVLAEELYQRGIQTKKYFYPPLHQQKCYADWCGQNCPLELTENIAQNILSVPLYSHMPPAEVTYITTTIKQVREKVVNRELINGKLLNGEEGNK